MTKESGRRTDAQAVVRHWFVIRISSLTLSIPPGIGYRGKALAKFSLLSLRFHLLVGVACLLLGTRT
jgi:hypothetical protein